MSSWKDFVKKNYHQVIHLKPKERFGALSKMRGGMLEPEEDTEEEQDLGDEPVVVPDTKKKKRSKKQQKEALEDFEHQHQLAENLNLPPPIVVGLHIGEVPLTGYFGLKKFLDSYQNAFNNPADLKRFAIEIINLLRHHNASMPQTVTLYNDYLDTLRAMFRPNIPPNLRQVVLDDFLQMLFEDVNKKKFLARVPPRRPPPSSNVPRTGTISDEKRIERTLSDFFTLVLEMDTSGGQEIESVLLDYVLSALEAVKEGRRRRQDFVPNVVEYFIGYLRAEGIELNPTEISMLERLLATLL